MVLFAPCWDVFGLHKACKDSSIVLKAQAETQPRSGNPLKACTLILLCAFCMRSSGGKVRVLREEGNGRGLLDGSGNRYRPSLCFDLPTLNGAVVP
jgi:hypothetical protein